ncbi:MYG1 exonuclease isoform X2 [Diprion similis]|nr:MYG1 exonuclease isoform X2 [Diprion similis]
MPGSEVTIGTHDGCFHCDEALACYMLKLLPRFKNASIVRTRDQKILDTCDIVVDVGGVYDPSTHRYDHHMREFKETLSTVIKNRGYKSTIKLSSAGLIYCHFGDEIIKTLVPEVTDDHDRSSIFKRVYETFMQEVDAIDNGVPMFDGEPLYSISTNLSKRVARLNPPWNGPELDVDGQFEKAAALTGEEFTYFVQYAARVWWPARSIVKDAILRRFEIHPSGEIIELSTSLPWKEHLYELEEELGVKELIKYAIFQSGNYRVQCVPVQSTSFVCRMFLPEAWAGMRDEKLCDVSGIADCVFVHSVRFIGGHKTRAGALAMAVKALEIGKSIESGHAETNPK